MAEYCVQVGDVVITPNGERWTVTQDSDHLFWLSTGPLTPSADAPACRDEDPAHAAALDACYPPDYQHPEDDHDAVTDWIAETGIDPITGELR